MKYLFLLCFAQFSKVNAFTLKNANVNVNVKHHESTSFLQVISKKDSKVVLHSSAPSDVDDLNLGQTSLIENPERDELKAKLIRLCASYDRGFGASPNSKKQVDDIIDQLKVLNPTPVDAARGIEGNGDANFNDSPPPLEGIWRMVWTTALDVLNLAASPIATPSAIYQVIDPPIATNIIDFIPRAQSLFPSAFPSSLIRAEVKTRASKRIDQSNRVGLDFESVKLAPVQVLGMDAKSLPPLNINLPRINVSDLPGVGAGDSPGFFDVVYLDDDMLIIQQNAPGGYFVSIKVPDCDP